MVALRHMNSKNPWMSENQNESKMEHKQPFMEHVTVTGEEPEIWRRF